MGMSEFAKYAWFFICYSLLNAVFYTANNIAYSALTSLVTKNSAERVEMGSYRFMFASPPALPFSLSHCWLSLHWATLPKHGAPWLSSMPLSV